MIDTPADPVANPLDWLDAASAAVDATELPRLRAALACLERMPTDARYTPQLARADALLHGLLQRLRPEFRASALPLAREARARSVELCDALDLLAGCHQRLLLDAGRIDSARAGLLALYRRLEIGALCGAGVPPGFWRRASALYRIIDRFAPADGPEQDAANKARLGFVRLLALICATPEHLSAAEIGELVDWLDETMIPIVLHDSPSPSADDAWFWLDLDLDQGPHQFGRRSPPARSGIVTFSLAPLASHALASAALLAPAREGDAAEPESGSPAHLLRRIADLFSTAHRRRLARRRNNYRVSVCTGLDEIRRAITAGGAQPTLSEWMVVNESAGGFAMMHIGGHIEGIVSGGVVALRAGEAEPWTVCLVRWSRSDNPEHVELGLQILGYGAQAVDIAFRAGASGGARALRPALLLPALPALRQKFAILAPAGSYVSRRFVMVAQTDHVYVAQGRLISLDVQTAAIELFQFELDPYPI